MKTANDACDYASEVDMKMRSAKRDSAAALEAKNAADIQVKTAEDAVAAISTESKVLDDLQAQYDSGSIGWFKHNGSIEALDALTYNDEDETKYKSYFYDGTYKELVGATTDLLNSEYAKCSATTMDNFERALDIIAKCNEIRRTNGIEPLRVSDALMAYAEVNANWNFYVSDKLQHTGVFDTGENLAAGYDNPFDGWYDMESFAYEHRDLSSDDFLRAYYFANAYAPTEERAEQYIGYLKKDAENAGIDWDTFVTSRFRQTGHRANILSNPEKDYVTGAARASNLTAQEFGGEYAPYCYYGGDYAADYDTYRTAFEAYKSDLEAKIEKAKADKEEAEQKLGEAKATLNEALAAQKAAQEALDQAAAKVEALQQPLAEARANAEAAIADQLRWFSWTRFLD